MLFDLDGIITDAAAAHARAWKAMFDAFLRGRAEELGEPSRNRVAVLRAAGLLDLFRTRVDNVVAADLVVADLSELVS